MRDRGKGDNEGKGQCRKKERQEEGKGKKSRMFSVLGEIVAPLVTGLRRHKSNLF